MKNGVRWIAIAFLCLTALRVPGAAEESSCVSCHRKTGASAYMQHNFRDWEESAHAQAGVGCEACHGGNPLAQDMAKAHEGVISSTKKESPLYFSRVPESCGTCHREEHKAFKASVHYKALQSTGQGPNCVTCHGSMANQVLEPREMEMTCTLCHRRPTQAYLARMGLADSQTALIRLEKALRRAKAAGIPTESQDRAFVELYKLQRTAQVDWHTFDMPKVLAAEQDIKARAKAAIGELSAKEPKPAKP
jgi:hypothetical protein